MYKFGGLGKKYISPIGAESALFPAVAVKTAGFSRSTTHLLQ